MHIRYHKLKESIQDITQRSEIRLLVGIVVYAPYTSGTYNLTGIIRCVINAPNLITGCLH